MSFLKRIHCIQYALKYVQKCSTTFSIKIWIKIIMSIFYKCRFIFLRKRWVCCFELNSGNMKSWAQTFDLTSSHHLMQILIPHVQLEICSTIGRNKYLWFSHVNGSKLKAGKSWDMVVLFHSLLPCNSFL